jgi:hypothetical protein
MGHRKCTKGVSIFQGVVSLTNSAVLDINTPFPFTEGHLHLGKVHLTLPFALLSLLFFS